MVEQEVNIKYPIAKQDHLIQQLPQFRIIKKGARKRGVERIYHTKDKKTIVVIRMFKELDIADQDLLLAILAIALPIDRGVVLSSKSKKNIELWQGLNTKGILAEVETIYITTSFSELNRELNKSHCGTAIKWIEESLTRLMNTTIEIDNGNKKSGTNFLNYTLDRTTNKINIVINPLSAVVLLGDKKGYILHNRKERLALKTTPARALYSILVGLVNIHHTKTLSIYKLIEKMHLTNWEETTTQQKKDLKKSFKKAIEEINKLKKWTIIDNKNSTITIKRV